VRSRARRDEIARSANRNAGGRRLALSIFFDGIAYAMILFVLAVGLSITMGLMGVINLAHGAFAMAGGYLALVLVNRLAVPFVPALLLAPLLVAILSVPFERMLYTSIYGRGELDQILMTIGLVLMSMAAATWMFGPTPVTLKLPESLDGTIEAFGREVPAYRAFIVGVGAAVFTALWFSFERTVLGAKIRAVVDNRAMAEASGINTTRLFTLTFALGCGLAALGGVLAVNVVGLTPRFAIQYLVPVLAVVAVGGLGTIGGTMAAALVIGVADVAVRYFFPGPSAFLIYVPILLVMLFRPRGLLGKA
jgi:branched-chain amino acid transport system permease protein